MRNITLTVLLLAFTIFLGKAQEKDSTNELTVEKIWKEYQFYGNGISGFRSMKDGKHYSRFALVDEKKSIMRYSFEDLSGTGENILDGKELVYKGVELKVDGYEFNEDETKLLLTVNRQKRYRRSFSAEYYLYDLKSKTLL